MPDDRSKPMHVVAIQWIAAVVASQEGWAVKKGAYRRGITVELDPLVAWLNRCHESSGQLPTYTTTIESWPKLPWPADPVPETFASMELEQAYKRWDVVQHLHSLDLLLKEGTTNEAYDAAARFGTMSGRSSTPRGVELVDPDLYVDEEVDTIDLPSWGSVLKEAPVHRDDYMLLAARTNVGKSWFLQMAALDAIQQGWEVVMYSLEMDSRKIAKRSRALLPGVRDVPAWIRSQPGRLYVIDQASQRAGYTATDLVNRVDQGSRSFIIVDYGELMRPETGGRATEGWNKSAEVSQALQNVAKYVKVPVLVAVQDNRSAVGQKTGVETLSGSDYWGRDADTVMRLRDETGDPSGSGRTRVLEMVKTRHTGYKQPSFFRFDPEGRGIEEIDRVQYAADNAKE